MNKKKISIALVFTFLLGPFAIKYPISNEIFQERTIIQPNIAVEDVNVSVNDVFIYRIYDPNELTMNQYEMDLHNRTDKIVKHEFISVTPTEIIYDIFVLNTTLNSWDYIETVNENYTQTQVFNHNYIPTNITDIQVFNNTIEDMDTLFENQFNISPGASLTSYVTTGGWHNLTFVGDQDDNPLTPIKINVVVNVSTGFINYMLFEDVNQMEITELISFESAEFVWNSIDTFGYSAGDVIEVFIPNDKHHDDEFIDEKWGNESDTEPNNLYTESYLISSLPALLDGLEQWDDDYYSLVVNLGDTIDIDIMYDHMNPQNMQLEGINPANGAVIFTDANPSDGLHYSFTSSADNTEYIFAIKGDNNGAWYGLDIRINGNHMWEYVTEPNNLYTSPYHLNIPGHWNGMVQNDPDYYSFFLEAGQRAEIRVMTDMNPGLVLRDINPGDGTTIQQDDSSEDGELLLHIDAGSDMDYLVEVLGDNSGRWYAIEVFYDHDDFQDEHGGSVWEKIEVISTYHNPSINSDICIVNITGYDDPLMGLDNIKYFIPYVIGGIVDPLNWSSSIGQRFFHANLDFSDSDFRQAVADQLIAEHDLISNSQAFGTEWLNISGTTVFGEEFVFAIEKFPDYGFLQGMIQEIENETHYEEHWQMTIDGPGVIDTNPNLGVNEGYKWETIMQFKNHNHELWDNNGIQGENNWDDQGFMNSNYTVTHIFKIFRNITAVIGNVDNFVSTHPGEIKVEKFHPLLIWNYSDPVSFLDYEMDGPPLVLPIGENWNLLSSEFLSRLPNAFDEVGSVRASHFEENNLRFNYETEFHDTLYDENGNMDLYLEIDPITGIANHLSFRNDYHESFHDDVNNEYREMYRFEQFELFRINSSKTPVTSFPGISPVQPNDQFTWQRSEYRSEEPEPVKIHYERERILDLKQTEDGSIIIIGEHWMRGEHEPMYHPDEWFWGGTPGPGHNIWMLESIRVDDPWSWMNDRIFDQGVADITTVNVDILNMLSYAFGIPISSDNVTITPNTIEMVKEYGDGTELVFKFAVSAEGILQDQIIGHRWISNGTWRNFERLELIEAPSGYTIGTFFDAEFPDIINPVITLTSNTDLEVIDGDTIEFTVTDDISGVASVQYTWNGGTLIPITGPYSIDITGLSLGNHDLTIRAEDNAGNIAQLTWSFLVKATDGINPVIIITSNTDFEVIDGDTIEFTVTDDNSGVASVQYTWNGGTLIPITGPYSIDVTGLSLGNHDLTIRAEDNAGNVAQLTWTFLVKRPENNTGPTDTTDPTDPGGNFEIPSYPINLIYIFSMISISIAISKKKRNLMNI